MNETAPSSVHTQQTNSEFSYTSSYRQHTDRTIRPKIQFVSDVYAAVDNCEWSKRVQRLAECRSKAYFMRHEDTGMLRIASSHCNLRWCPLCARTRRNFIAGQTRDWLKTVSRPKLLTVTLKHSSDCLADQMNVLYKSFQLLRKRKILRKNIKGGMWFFQVTKSDKTGLWHPHVHSLIDSAYIPQNKIRMAWLDITGESSIVDIRPIKDKDKTALHVARYAAVPCDLSRFTLDEASEIVDDLNGRRLCGTWGTARVVSLRPHKPDDADKWHRFGSWTVVCNQANFDDGARAILRAWKKNEPVDVECDCSRYDSLIAGKVETDWDPPPTNPQPLLFEAYGWPT